MFKCWLSRYLRIRISLKLIQVGLVLKEPYFVDLTLQSNWANMYVLQIL
jgi:hypothetical protein